MNYELIYQKILRPDIDFSILRPHTSNILYHKYVTDSTIQKVRHRDWEHVEPQHFKLVELVDKEHKKLRLHTEAGSCTVTAARMDEMYLGYADIYMQVLERCKSAEEATAIALVGWYQYFNLHHMVFVPDPSSTDWLLYQAWDYENDPVVNKKIGYNSLVALYPDAGPILDSLRVLDASSQSVVELIEKTCVYSQPDSLGTGQEVTHLPNNF